MRALLWVLVRSRLALKSKSGLKQCRVINQSTDRPNISLMVFKVSPQNPISYFSGTIQELKTKGIHCSRLVVYCQKISDCSSLYFDFMGELGDRAQFTGLQHHALKIYAGRVVRDGRASYACLLFHGHQLRHCDNLCKCWSM